MANNQYAGTQGMPGTQMNGQGGDTALPGVGPIASSSQFVEIPFNGGLKTPHYFDGRLLSAGDLQTDQDATLQRQYWLARASGYGVIDGLVVTKVPTDTTQISVTRGLGLTRSGKILSLSNTATFAPIPPVQTNSNSTKAVNAGQFTSPAAQKAANMKTVPAGVYMLAASPTSHYEGQVPMKAAAGSFTTSGIANPAGCGSQWEVEGLHFKVIRLDDDTLLNLLKGVDPKSFTVNDKTRRNLLAHWCYGTIALQELGKNPFTFPDIYGGLDASVIPDLTDDDLPLVVFHWDGGAIDSVDMWSVRRRVIRPDALLGTQRFAPKGRWSALVSDQHVAENQARFLQFQDELDDLVNKSNNFKKGSSPNGASSLTKVRAVDYFAFLPAMGFLPITAESLQNLICKREYKLYKPPTPVKQPPQREPNPNQPPSSHNWLRALLSGIGGGAAVLGGAGEVGLSLGRGSILAATLGQTAEVGALFTGPVGLAADVLLTVGGISLARIASDPNFWLNLQHHLGISSTGTTQVQETQSSGPDLTKEIVGEIEQRMPDSQGELSSQPEGSASSSVQTSETSGREVKPEQRQLITADYVLRHLICELLAWQEKNKPHNSDGCFDLEEFFDGIRLRINLIGSDHIDLFLDQSWHEEAIDLRSVGQQDAGTTPTTIEDILHKLPLIIDIYIVEENLIDSSQPLYIMFRKVLHTSELIDPRGVIAHPQKQ